MALQSNCERLRHLSGSFHLPLGEAGHSCLEFSLMPESFRYIVPSFRYIVHRHLVSPAQTGCPFARTYPPRGGHRTPADSLSWVLYPQWSLCGNPLIKGKAIRSWETRSGVNITLFNLSNAMMATVTEREEEGLHRRRDGRSYRRSRI